jgi:rubrerythrin
VTNAPKNPPTRFQSVDDALNFAIEKEEEAADFYTEMAGQMKRPWMKEIFEDFAHEELGHKAKLIAIQEGRLLVSALEKVMDLKIADYMVAAVPNPDMSYPQALKLAMQREKASFRLYIDLAAATENSILRATFQMLAQEEAKHKLRFELEYDREVLAEN